MHKLSLLAVALVVVTASCSKKSSAPTNSANVMFVNACIPSFGSFNIDAKSNGATVSGATNIGFLKNSGYVYVTANTNDSLTFVVNGLSTYLVGGISTITVNANYSVFATGTNSSPVPAIVITQDDLTAPSAGNAKVRFVNLGPDNLNERCYIGSSLLDSNVTYKTVTPFTEITAGSYNVLMQDPANPTKLPLTALNGQAFAAGKIYTVMLSGLAAVSGTTGLTYTIINNN